MRSFFGRMRSDGNQDPVTAGWSRDVTVELRSMRGLAKILEARQSRRDEDELKEAEEGSGFINKLKVCRPTAA